MPLRLLPGIGCFSFFFFSRSCFLISGSIIGASIVPGLCWALTWTGRPGTFDFYWDHSSSIKLHSDITLTSVSVVAVEAFCHYLAPYFRLDELYFSRILSCFSLALRFFTENGDRVSLEAEAVRSLTIAAGDRSDPTVLRRMICCASNYGHISNVCWAESKTDPHLWQPGCTSAPIPKHPCPESTCLTH